MSSFRLTDVQRRRLEQQLRDTPMRASFAAPWPSWKPRRDGPLPKSPACSAPVA
jgi:hypothetical protein